VASSPGSHVHGVEGEEEGAGAARHSGREGEGDSVGRGVVQAREGLLIYLSICLCFCLFIT
jgi:hypothetical protein